MYAVLLEMATQARERETTTTALKDHFTSAMKPFSAAKIEYIEIVDSVTLHPVNTAKAGSTICVAVWFEDVRLIDNISI